MDCLLLGIFEMGDADGAVSAHCLVVTSTVAAVQRGGAA